MNFIKKHIKIVIIILLTIISVGAITLKYKLSKNEKEIIEEETIEIAKKEEVKKDDKKKVNVDIKGAIKNPGVYEIEENSMIIDLVKLSGGLTNEADTTYINLAKKVSDEMVVIIYTKDQIKIAKEKETLSTTNINNSCICPKISNDACITKSDTSTTNKNTKTETNSKSNDNSKEHENKIININTATKEELQTLTGVGASKADAIISYREEFGNFTTTEDIMNVSGIGESLYEKIKDNITV